MSSASSISPRQIRDIPLGFGRGVVRPEFALDSGYFLAGSRDLPHAVEYQNQLGYGSQMAITGAREMTSTGTASRFPIPYMDDDEMYQVLADDPEWYGNDDETWNEVDRQQRAIRDKPTQGQLFQQRHGAATALTSNERTAPQTLLAGVLGYLHMSKNFGPMQIEEDLSGPAANLVQRMAQRSGLPIVTNVEGITSLPELPASGRHPRGVPEEDFGGPERYEGYGREYFDAASVGLSDDDSYRKGSGLEVPTHLLQRGEFHSGADYPDAVEWEAVLGEIGDRQQGDLEKGIRHKFTLGEVAEARDLIRRAPKEKPLPAHEPDSRLWSPWQETVWGEQERARNELSEMAREREER